MPAGTGMRAEAGWRWKRRVPCHLIFTQLDAPRDNAALCNAGTATRGSI